MASMKIAIGDVGRSKSAPLKNARVRHPNLKTISKIQNLFEGSKQVRKLKFQSPKAVRSLNPSPCLPAGVPISPPIQRRRGAASFTNFVKGAGFFSQDMGSHTDSGSRTP